MSEVTDTQLIFLDNLIYLDLGKISGEYNYTLEKIIKTIITDIDEYFNPLDPPAAMTKEEWVNLLTAFKDNPANEEFLNDYKISNYETYDTNANGFRASCFVKSDNSEKPVDVIAVFRGTYGGAEWKDDLMMANNAWSEEMDKATKYIYDLPEEYGNNITVSGHSKGGNKAQYVTITTDRIGRCVSYDGQGFSDEFLNLYEPIIAERKDKITSISSEYDYVNGMLYPIAGTIKYIDTDMDSDYALNHCPNRVFDENANLRGEVDEAFIVTQLIAHLTQDPLKEISDPVLEDILNSVSDNLVVPLLSKKEDGNQGEVDIVESIPVIISLVRYFDDDAYEFLREKNPALAGSIDILSTYISYSNPELFCVTTIVDALLSVSTGVNELWSEYQQEKINEEKKSEFINEARKFVSSYKIAEKAIEKERNGFGDLFVAPPLCDYEKTFRDALSENLGKREDELADIYYDFLMKYRDIIFDVHIAENLSNEDLTTLNNLRNLIDEVEGENSELDRLSDSMEYISGRFGLAIESSKHRYDPLVIDLGKNGFELTKTRDGVHFDMDVNGFAEKTAWVKGSDGFLAFDLNGDGIINNSGELFGDRTLLQDGTYAETGFQALAQYDKNGDNLINSKDAIYKKLLVWQDKNQDGIFYFL